MTVKVFRPAGMSDSYRIVKIEPSYRVVRTKAPAQPSVDGTEAEPSQVIRIEHSYRIVNSEGAPQGQRARSAAVQPPAPPQPAANEDQFLKDFVNSIPDALLLMSASGTILFANATCSALLGYQPDELTGQPIEILLPLAARSAHRKHRALYHANPSPRPMARIPNLSAVAKDGRLIPVDVAVNPVGNGPEPRFVVAIRDASEHQAIVQGLEQLAATDHLTGLLNRRSFQSEGVREFERFRRQGSPLSVMVLDIDHFKNINDTYGHDAGDKVLTQLATACLAKLRKTDIMARLGGEEFAIIVPGTRPEVAISLAERLRVSLSEIETTVADRALKFTVSIGLAEVKATDQSLDDATTRADHALYEAKRTGRNKVVAAI